MLVYINAILFIFFYNVKVLQVKGIYDFYIRVLSVCAIKEILEVAHETSKQQCQQLNQYKKQMTNQGKQYVESKNANQRLIKDMEKRYYHHYCNKYFTEIIFIATINIHSKIHQTVSVMSFAERLSKW